MAKLLRKMMAQELSKEMEMVENFVVFGYGPINAEQNHQLRKLLLQNDIQIKMVKNTIAAVAFAKVYQKEFKDMLQGPTAIAYGGPSPVDVAKALYDWNRKHQLIKIKGGYLSGQVLDEKQVEDLSKIPSREILLSMLAGVLQAPIQQIATMLNAATQDLSYAFNALIDKKEEQPE